MTSPGRSEEEISLQSVVEAEYAGRSMPLHQIEVDETTDLDCVKISDDGSLSAPNRKIALATVDSLGAEEEAVTIPVAKHSYRAEILAQIQIAFPVCCTFVLRKSVDIVSLIYVGHLESNYLSAAGIAAVTSNVTGNSMVIGLAGALSTICSQSYGSKDFITFSVAPQRAVLILGLFICTPISFLWWYSEPVMIALGQVCHSSIFLSGCLTVRLFYDVQALNEFYADYLHIMQFLFFCLSSKTIPSIYAVILIHETICLTMILIMTSVTDIVMIHLNVKHCC